MFWMERTAAKVISKKHIARIHRDAARVRAKRISKWFRRRIKREAAKIKAKKILKAQLAETCKNSPCSVQVSYFKSAGGVCECKNEVKRSKRQGNLNPSIMTTNLSNNKVMKENSHRSVQKLNRGVSSKPESKRYTAAGIKSWNEKLMELRAFKAKYGHCLVPRSKIYQSLGKWVQNQRFNYKLYKEGKKSFISAERIALLKAEGFSWHDARGSWAIRFKELIEYNKRWGDTNIPKNYKQNPRLSSWVDVQRVTYRRRLSGLPNSMTDEQFQALRDIGFDGHS